MPSLFVVCLLIFAIGMAIFLAAKLLKSYPLVFLALIFVVASSLLAIFDDEKSGTALIGVLWLIFSAISVIASGLHLYKNIRGAFWWSLGAVVALIASAVPFGIYLEGTLGDILQISVPFVAFIVIGLVGSLVVPKLQFKDKNERKHLTNTEPLLGKRVKIYKDKKGSFKARARIGDIDWAVEPLFSYETFKLGDVVKICQIKGVTLLCTRDGKDYRQEMKRLRKERQAERRLEQEKLYAKHQEAKAARKLQAEKQKLAREKAKIEQEKKVKKLKEERAARKASEKAELYKVREERNSAKKQGKKELSAARNKTYAAKNSRIKARQESALKEVKKEKVARQSKKQNYKLFYLISSIVIILLSIALVVVVLMKLIPQGLFYAFVVYAVVVTAYLVALFILEVLKMKKGTKKGPKSKNKAKPIKKVEKTVVSKEQRRIQKLEAKEKARTEKLSKKLENEKRRLEDELSKTKKEAATRAEVSKKNAEISKIREEQRKIQKAHMAELKKAREATKKAKATRKASNVVVKEKKVEKVAVEKKPMSKFTLTYIILSAAIVLISILMIVLGGTKLVEPRLGPVQIAYIVLIFAYLAVIFVLEIIKSRKHEEKPEPKKQKAAFVPFEVRMKQADEEVRLAYNEIKSEILAYGIKSRVSSTGDTFRLHTKEYVKIVIAGKGLKLYMALDPKDYKNTTYPFDDASKMNAHKETPFVFKITSSLSVRRAKQLVADLASKNGLEKGEVVVHDHAKDL